MQVQHKCVLILQLHTNAVLQSIYELYYSTELTHGKFSEVLELGKIYSITKTNMIPNCAK